AHIAEPDPSLWAAVRVTAARRSARCPSPCTSLLLWRWSATCRSSCADDHRRGRAGGPWGMDDVVAVRFYDGTWCSGTLIDQQTVLTAAHCLVASRISSTYFGEEIDSSRGGSC